MVACLQTEIMQRGSAADKMAIFRLLAKARCRHLLDLFAAK